MKKGKITEHDIQVGICTMLNYHKIFYYSVPNGMYVGGFSSKRTQSEKNRVMGLIKKFKKEGMKNGIPDLVIPYPSNGYGALYIEVKTQTGRVSNDQKEKIAILEKCGNKAVVCKSVTQALYEVKKYFKKVTDEN